MSYCKLRRNVGSGSGCGDNNNKPTNAALAAENNKMFDSMMAERARQDALLFGGQQQQTQQPTTQQPTTQQQQTQQQQTQQPTK
jgi:hypothetical protein